MIELKALQGQVKALVEDLRGQVARNTELRSELLQEYQAAKDAERTGGTFETWLEDVLDQAAVAWVLGCVFVRFCEDNSLVEPLWIGGPEEHAPIDRAVRHRQAFMIEDPRRNDRDWLREAFTYLAGLRATGKIFDRHNPVWRFGISGEAAEELSDFFRRGGGFRSLHTPTLDTRFLGDLYQDLSAHARATYALLQTPVFVEEFILDRTFEPSVREFGLPNTSVIDPTCGSGHFLLGAFERLLKKWRDREPGEDIRVLTERALGQVTGVDINAFAVAIARFRLMIAALRACGLSSLERAPQFPIRVATGDSLLEWGEKSSHQGDLVALAEGRPAFAYYAEDGDLLKQFLVDGLYTVVVGNPPYITVKDKVLNGRYRRVYSACLGLYAMTVPFAQRFFKLAKRGDRDGDGAGWVGQITANSFMKREFGKRLINEYLAGQVELNEVVDTSGAYIPGHGTPTVILVGQNRLVSLRYSNPIRAVLGVRGEPGTPDDPANAHVWTAIVNQIDCPGSGSDWITVGDVERSEFSKHPWSLSGGSASTAMAQIVNRSRVVGDVVESIGYTGQTNADDVFIVDGSALIRHGIGEHFRRPFVTGDDVRDYRVRSRVDAVFPYGLGELADVQKEENLWRWLWPMRTTLWARATFSGKTYRAEGRSWWQWHQVAGSRLSGRAVTWAFVQTLNHFAYQKNMNLHNRHAPVIKLPEGASEDEHLRLLGLLNSSTACFWLKQVSHDKGIRGEGGGFTSDDWEHFYEFTGTKLAQFPLPERYPLELSRRIDRLAQRLATVTPAAVAASGVPTRERLAAAREEWHSIRAQMIALQEELDWQVYQLYGLRDEDLSTMDPPELKLGERAFEIVLARSGAEPEWFARHGSTPIKELPEQWPADYRALVERRIAVIESDRNIGLIERPECKRRWATEGFESQQSAALRDWLLDRLEAPEIWGARPEPLSVAQLADRVRHDDDFRAVLDLWVGSDQHDLAKTLGKLVAEEHVPFLPADRYKAAGLRKRAQWERTWALQRLEDKVEAEGKGEKPEIAVPPKYTSTDFAKPSYWRNRGKLDVPKERFISYPRLGRNPGDGELLGWAGWDHLAQAQALATAYLERKTQAGWKADQLLPFLAGLAELEPWLKQWHADPRPGFPGSPAAFFSGLIDTELSYLGSDRSTLRKLRGVEELS